MHNPTHTPAFLRRRRLLLVLPLLVLPLLSLLFWALGGGAAPAAAAARAPGGLNRTLPAAHLEEGLSAGKLNYYKQAATDTGRWRELIGGEAGFLRQQALPPAPAHGMAATKYPLPPQEGGADLVSQEAQVHRQLEQLNAVLAAEASPIGTSRDMPMGASSGKEMARLEQLVGTPPPGGEDPALRQLDGMLEKILDIQHPGRVREKERQVPEHRQRLALPVVPREEATPVTLLGPGGEGAGQDPGEGFYAWEADTAPAPAQNSIGAVVHGTQTVTAGALVRLRLTGEVLLQGRLLPKDTFVYGTASLEGERLRVRVSGIRYQQALFPVELSVYDLDGVEGIHIPGALTREAARAAADRAVQDLSLPLPDPGLGAQVARAGVEAARGLFSKRARQVKATLPDGYRVLLRGAGLEEATY